MTKKYWDGENWLDVFEGNETKYYLNGNLHRKDGPAIIEYRFHYKLQTDTSGNNYYQIINEIACQKYYLNGKLHRKDGPALIEYFDNDNNEIVSYYLNGKLHREDGPAIIEYFDNGNKNKKHYYFNGKLHRENGPSEIWYYKNGNVNFEEYRINGKLHRKDGPAEIWYYKNDGFIEKEKYYFNGIEFKPEELSFKMPIDNPEKIFMFKLKYGE